MHGKECVSMHGGWGLRTLDAFLRLIRHFYASRVGDMRLKEKCFGNKSLLANMGRKMEVGGLVNRVRVMRWGYGKLSRRVGKPFIANLPLWYEMRGG